MIEVEASAVVAACDTMLNNPIAKLTGEEYGIFPVELGMGRSAEPISGIALTPLRISWAIARRYCQLPTKTTPDQKNGSRKSVWRSRCSWA
jgi:hypothetical protein